METLYTIGQLAKRCGISRTTLLYYEKLGLIEPASRSEAGYRRYSGHELARVGQVRQYRAAGLALETIAALLADGDRSSLIRRRLDDIQREIAQLREQQALLVRLLSDKAALEPAMDKARWTALLRGAGVDDAAMGRWHALFEKQAPEAHQAFLLSLGLDAGEMEHIRSWARQIGV
ncbi:MerR family DNA-binding transcriptional regulator [Duganella sp. FT92W]|uniref:MerR family DNA-binding transcriptional regulator n=1 Tax=Pseudoduganella rivuli TaxID=2666085 RepID=A0A7X2IJK6_9BURK|nr:MerR family DNA-binding transcriptional regulator [Pseudoduganella rivuli]MRV71020.1 MerR family DNA-binding transcriptional regulator [Pseudoduganella rivuli]